MTKIELEEVSQGSEGSCWHNSQSVVVQTECVEVGDELEGGGWYFI